MDHNFGILRDLKREFIYFLSKYLSFWKQLLHENQFGLHLFVMMSIIGLQNNHFKSHVDGWKKNFECFDIMKRKINRSFVQDTTYIHKKGKEKVDKIP